MRWYLVRGKRLHRKRKGDLTTWGSWDFVDSKEHFSDSTWGLGRCLWEALGALVFPADGKLRAAQVRSERCLEA